MVRIRIRISSRELGLLKSCQENLKIGSNDSAFELYIDNEIELETIINNVSNYFMKKGLKFNNEPNSLGYELEELNDKFVQELQKIK